MTKEKFIFCVAQYDRLDHVQRKSSSMYSQMFLYSLNIFEKAMPYERMFEKYDFFQQKIWTWVIIHVVMWFWKLQNLLKSKALKNKGGWNAHNRQLERVIFSCLEISDSSYIVWLVHQYLPIYSAWETYYNQADSGILAVFAYLLVSFFSGS